MIFERIKELADKQGKSLQKVSENLGFSQNYFYNLKNAKSSPSADVLVKVADYFHVSVDYLLEREAVDNYARGFIDGTEHIKKSILKSLKEI